MLKGRDILEIIAINGRIICKCILKKFEAYSEGKYRFAVKKN